ncbi:MAG: hypothetical protein PHR98_02085 [Candidatus Shapirobacteria bacterium]|nr:hypothetical protein [Candidatus Shapirobacteria bacterium]
MIVIVGVTLGIGVGRRGYFISGNLFTKDIVIGSEESIGLFKRYLTEDRDKIIWWRIRYSNKIIRNNLVLWNPTSDGGVFAGCTKDKILFGGFIREIEIWINSDLLDIIKESDLNRIFIRCSMIPYNDDYKSRVVSNFVDLFSQGKFILKKR